MSQVNIEKALIFITAKPLAWLVYWLWLALKHGWLGAVWCARWIRERWRTWRSAGKESAACVDSASHGRSGRMNKRELARR